MRPTDAQRKGDEAPRESFPATHWSVVLSAGDDDAARAAAALEKLCRTYWYPLYAFVRRQGHKPEEAEDLIQEFFVRLIARRDLETVRQERGRFRSYLLVSLKHFLINEWKRSQTQRRGGGHTFVPLDQTQAEGAYSREPQDNETGETIFERRWAVALLQQVLARLEQEYATTGRSQQFDALRSLLSDEPTSRSHAEIARELGINENAAKQAAHRMRTRYRQLLREEIANTVATARDVEDELRHLVTILRR